MSDMRQKLLPVFLEEASRNIVLLDNFIASGSEKRTLVDLEAAFRAAHTLKGTSALVQAEAVRTLSARIEGLLEGHFEQSRFPSEVEFEAMLLALDRLKRLIDAVARNIAEPAGVLAEAELALKLAAAMPGRRTLVELMTPVVLADPFADDPELDASTSLIDAADAPAYITDPFADDPAIDQEPEDLPLNLAVAESIVLDPFADDPELDTTPAETLASTTRVTIPDFTAINDPFADDPELDYPPSVDLFDNQASRVAEAPSLREVSVAEPAAELHPEGSFIERMRKRIEKESPLQTAERLAKTLLAQDSEEAESRHYACCHFRVAEKDYYLPIANMIEISDLPKLIHLPLAPPVVKGLINLRGQILPVIDLGSQAAGVAKYVPVRKLVVAEAGGEKLAFLSDGIPDLSEVFLGEKVDVMKFVDQFRAGAT